MLAFFFPPSPIEIAVIGGASFFVLLPEIHRGYCYARWFKSGDEAWLDHDKHWRPPRLCLPSLLLLVAFIVVAITVKAHR
jgi:hypothetical protein